MISYADFWIDSTGRVKEMGGSEHAEEALRALLKLPPDFSIPKNRLYTAISPKEASAAKKRGANEAALKYLSRTDINPDPRTWMIQKEHWIRVARDLFNVYAFDQPTLDLIRESAYWDVQPQATGDDMIRIDELSTGDQFDVPVKALRYKGAQADVVKQIAMARGQFDIPEHSAGTDYEEAQRHLRRPGGYTDSAGDDGWIYRRIGENPH